jgi:hypothetical protein
MAITMTLKRSNKGHSPSGGWQRRQQKALFTIITALYILSGTAHAVQPVEAISKNPERYFAKQGPAQCGPTAFYLVLKFFGDNCKGYPYFYDREGSPLDLGKCGQDNDKNQTEIVDENSPVSAWIKGNNASTAWSSLLAGIRGLYYKNEKGFFSRYYPVVDSYDSVTPISKTGSQIRKTNFTMRLVPEFLDKNRPVIIHLKRKWPFPGHYLVLIGYDSTAKKVYYMDPNGEMNSVVKSVDADEFVDTFWYAGNAPALWGKARWSGKWVGFYRIEDDNARSGAPKN